MIVLTVVGARPQFVKAALLSREFEAYGITERLVHTGQHYDVEMSDVFFRQLKLPKPYAELGVGSGSHANQTARMMLGLEPLFTSDLDYVLVYGDTNSTLAGALVASKLQIPLVHVEAGLRSFNRAMPEEINRIVADQLADVLLAPSERAAGQLRAEGARGATFVAGDLMVDLARECAASLPSRPEILQRFELSSGSYALATVHRAANTDDPATFARIVAGLRAIDMPVIFPIHPRTLPIARTLTVGHGDNIIVCEPLPYLRTLELIKHARVVLTDSGGMQKEAVALEIPCVTLREETEWIETLTDEWNVLVGSDTALIVAAAHRAPPRVPPRIFSEGGSAERIVQALRLCQGYRNVISCAS